MEANSRDLSIQTGRSSVRREECPLLDSAALTAFAAARFPQDGLVIVWQPQRILWGRWRGGAFSFADGGAVDPAQLEEMRIFNETGELRLERRGVSFTARQIEDGPGAASEFVDSQSRFWGQKTAGAAAGFVRLVDGQRKISADVPAEETEDVFYGLATRNYVVYDAETGQAGYGDYRFLRIVAMGRE